MSIIVRTSLLLACLGVLAVWYLLFTTAHRQNLRLNTNSGAPQPPEVMPSPWPPVIGSSFPNLKLIDHRGQNIEMSQFKGKVILVEPIGMTCPACNAMAGAATKGSLLGTPMPNAISFEKEFSRYTQGLSLQDERIVFVQLLLYNLQMNAPTQLDTKIWAEHYQFDNIPNTYVVAPVSDIRNKVSYDMIPGFYLIDQNFILRSDATGHHPKHSLWKHLLPMVPKLVTTP